MKCHLVAVILDLSLLSFHPSVTRCEDVGWFADMTGTAYEAYHCPVNISARHQPRIRNYGCCMNHSWVTKCCVVDVILANLRKEYSTRDDVREIISYLVHLRVIKTHRLSLLASFVLISTHAQHFFRKQTNPIKCYTAPQWHFWTRSASGSEFFH